MPESLPLCSSLYQFDGSILNCGYEFNFFFKKSLLLIFSLHLIFKLAFLLTFNCVPFIVCRVSLILFFLNIFHWNVIFSSSIKTVPDLGLALTHSVSEILSFRKTEWSPLCNTWGWPTLFLRVRSRGCISILFRHVSPLSCHARGIKASLLFLFLLVATFMLILCIAPWLTCLSGYWRMI